jgi:hypothetical protein
MKKTTFHSEVLTVSPPVYFCELCQSAIVRHRGARCYMCLSNPIVITLENNGRTWRLIAGFAALLLALYGLSFIFR